MQWANSQLWREQWLPTLSLAHSLSPQLLRGCVSSGAQPGALASPGDPGDWGQSGSTPGVCFRVVSSLVSYIWFYFLAPVLHLSFPTHPVDVKLQHQVWEQHTSRESFTSFHLSRRSNFFPSFFLNFFFFQLKYSWLTMLCHYTLYSKVTQFYTYVFFFLNIIFCCGLPQEIECKFPVLCGRTLVGSNFIIYGFWWFCVSVWFLICAERLYIFLSLSFALSTTHCFVADILLYA